MLLLSSQGMVDDACGSDPSFICREVLDRTDSVRWAELSDVLFAKPLTILVILGVALVARYLLRHAIERFIGSLSGDKRPSRRIKRKLRGTAFGQRLPEGVLVTAGYSLRSAARAQTLGVVLKSLAGFVIWSIAVITILGELGVNLGPLVAGAGIVGVALGFGAQSLVKDFLAGVFILIEDQYGVGDIIDAGEATGTVEAVSLRTTRLRDVNGAMWHIPNGQIVRVGNMSQQWARALLDVSVNYEADLEVAQATIKRVADEVWQDPKWARKVLEEPEVWGVEDFGADGITIRLVVKTQPSEQFKVLRELRVRLKMALDEAGIEIPYPQRTVWVRRGADAPEGSPPDDLEL
ncbi:MAG: mechanosensitive ion channel family protein [Acidimicrobiales bacterium]